MQLFHIFSFTAPVLDMICSHVLSCITANRELIRAELHPQSSGRRFESVVESGTGHRPREMGDGALSSGKQTHQTLALIRTCGVSSVSSRPMPMLFYLTVTFGPDGR